MATTSCGPCSRCRSWCGARGSTPTRPWSSTGTARRSARGCCAGAGTTPWRCSTSGATPGATRADPGPASGPSRCPRTTDSGGPMSGCGPAGPRCVDAIGDPRITVVDVRSRDEFDGDRFWPSGGMEDGGRAGHVPGARHLPVDGLTADDGSFRPTAVLAVRCAGLAPDRRRRDHHLLHDRRPGGHGLVRPDLPARSRPRAGVRRFLGRVGSHGPTCRSSADRSSRPPRHPRGHPAVRRAPR